MKYMKKSHLFLILLVALVAVLVAGCTTQKTTGRFIGGDKGLEISFIDQEPPNEVLDNSEDEFDITLRLRNVGEASIPAGKIIATLNGINKDDFSLKSLSAVSDDDLERLQKIGDKVTQPDETELRFENAKYKFDLDASFDVDMRADVCYEYITTAVVDLCLKKDATRRRTGDQCQINNEQLQVDNSGAPVKVVSMSQRSSGSNKITFTIDIQNVGIGEVFEPGTFKDECGINEDKRDRVLVRVISRGDVPITCSKLNGNEGIVELFSGKRAIRCEIETDGLQDIAFLSRVNVVLSYYFKESSTKPISVVDSESF